MFQESPKGNQPQANMYKNSRTALSLSLSLSLSLRQLDIFLPTGPLLRAA